ncbi:MAG TPA: DUF2304 domain-containing protein [Microthrixaceae bacterium]|nr:DUF2304 domain-containing protein [Microthrixaceae bacterium]
MNTRVQVLWIALAVVLLAAVAVLLVLVRRRRLRGKYGLLWITVALALIPLALFPSFVDWLARKIGVQYAPAVIFLASIGLLMFVVMHYSWELSRLEERSRTLAEEVALLRSELAELRETDREDEDPAEVSSD